MEDEKLISLNQLEVSLLKELIYNELRVKTFVDHAFVKELENLYDRLKNQDPNKLVIQTYDPITEEKGQIFGLGVNAVKTESLISFSMEGLNYTADFDHYDGRRRLLIYRKDWEEPIAFYEGEDEEPEEK